MIVNPLHKHRSLSDIKLPCHSLTSQPFQPFLLALFADNEEQCDTQSDQDDGRADGEELFYVVTFSTCRLDGRDCTWAEQKRTVRHGGSTGRGHDGQKKCETLTAVVVGGGKLGALVAAASAVAGLHL